MDYDVVIAGAGPAGLFASIFAAGEGRRVLLAERMPSPARKLLASGAGQCNLTHQGEVAELLGHYGGPEAARFLKPALYAFDNDCLSTWFAERGLPLEATPEGKVFPATRRSRDVLALLLGEAARNGASIRASSRLVLAKVEAGGFRLGFEGPDGLVEFSSSALVLATGGLSWPSTGSTGDGFSIAASLGHGLAETAPALTPVLTGPTPFTACSGNALRDTTITVFRGGRKAASGSGDVLFTHRGLSGPGILDLSRQIRAKDSLRVALAPGAGADGAVLSEAEAEAEARLLAGADQHGSRAILRLVQSFGLVESVARALLAFHGVDPALPASRLTKEARRLIARSLAGGGEAGHPFEVVALAPFEEAMATRGGVPLREVDPKRMESRLVPGLFFAGEMLDYDGDTGGYNIQAAFSTGRLAGLAAAAHAGNAGGGRQKE